MLDGRDSLIPSRNLGEDSQDFGDFRKADILFCECGRGWLVCYLLWGFLAVTLPVAQFMVSKNAAASPTQQGLWLGQAAPGAMTLGQTHMEGPNICHSRDPGQAGLPSP